MIQYSPDITTNTRNTIEAWIELWLSKTSLFQLKTSGSTGVPKDITVTRNQLKTSAHLTLKTFDIQENDTMLINLNTDYIAGKMMLIRGIEAKMQILITMPKSNPLENIDNINFDFLSFVPLQLETILTQTPHKIAILNKAKAIIIGGAPINDNLNRLIQDIKAPVFHTYGMTETVSHIALKRLNGIEKTTYFETLKSVQITADESNCLKVNHDITNNQEIITNDIIELISPTKFNWIARADDIINSGGIKIVPLELEEKIALIFNKLQLKNRFFIFQLPHTKLGYSINLLIESEQHLTTKQLQYIKIELSANLHPFEIPKQVFQINKFNETPTQKINRKQTLNNFNFKN